MLETPRSIGLQEWDARYDALCRDGLREPQYGGRLSRHLGDGDYRLSKLRFDDSAAALRLWNLLLTEEERLHEARSAGKKIVGAMKDLGTVPVIAYALPELVAFYPDGAWWTPCLMECSDRLLQIADGLGVDDTFCPVRAMIGAFVARDRFPLPDLLVCSVGATCDDFSGIAQRLESLGHSILWWEMPHRRVPEPDEDTVTLPGGARAPATLVAFVERELERVRQALEELAGRSIEQTALQAAVREANAIRRCLYELRTLAYTADPPPLPALEMLIAEMLAIHYCSDRAETLAVLEELLATAREREASGMGVVPAGAARVFWVNPVADLRAMNLLEECGGRICGTDYMFTHALDPLPGDVPPLQALARAALADPMVGPAIDRAGRIEAEARRFGAEAVVVSRIPGASHCATEGGVIAEHLNKSMGIPVVEVEIPYLSDAMAPTLRTRLEALVETVKERRQRCS